MRKKIIITIIVVVSFFGLLALAKYLILGDAAVLKLSKNDDTKSAIASTIKSGTASNGSLTLPELGDKAKITNVVYFENQAWGVVRIESTNGLVTDPAYVVIHKQNGAYKVAAGPGTSFSRSGISTMPASVQAYLRDTLGITYSP